MPRLCIITGLQDEADCLVRSDDPEAVIEVIVAGTDLAGAIDQARKFIGRGCDGLISFGVAGGLHPELKAGDLVLADQIVAENGDIQSVHAVWVRTLHELCRNGWIESVTGPIAGTDIVLGTQAKKSVLHQSTKALAVDMESFAAAQLASRTGTRFQAIRAVADVAQQDLPPCLDSVVSADGRPRTKTIIAGLVRSPTEIIDVLKVAKNYRRAIKTLRRVALLSGPEFGLRDLLD